jgi:hypothetical protein
VVVTSSKAPIRGETRLKEAANSVTRWTSDNGFKISPANTKTMLIHRRRARTEGNTRFKIRVLFNEKDRHGQETLNVGMFDERLN